MSNEMLNEDIKDLFRDLLLQKDIDGERRLLQENGIDVDDKSLYGFHKKKEELFDFAKKNKDKLRTLDVDDLSNVSGGVEFISMKDAVSAAVGALLNLVRGSDVRDAVRGALEGLAVDVMVNVLFSGLTGSLT